MSKGIDYRRLMQKALRQFVSDVLSQVARTGLPGDNHFYITFDTTHPGVDMAPSLKARYPEEMTIVMQDWFTDLAVMKDRFSVTLNFGNVPEPLVIPFEAIKTFADPSVPFGVRVNGHPDEASDEEGTVEDYAPEPPHDGPKRGDRRGDAEIVSLDKFRKH